MKVKNFILFTLMVAMCGLTGYAKREKKYESYNFLRALEEADAGNNYDAMQYILKEVDENPKNGYAYCLLGVLQSQEGEYSGAMTSFNKALKLVPGKEKKLLSDTYLYRSHIYTACSDTVSAYADLEQALRLNPDNEDVYRTRAQLYFEQNRYDDADNDYRTLIRINPAEETGYSGLGRNAFFRDDYDEAVKQFTKVINMYDDHSPAFSLRAQSYLKQEKYAEAADDIMKALSIDNDTLAYMLLFQFPADRTPLLVAKLRSMFVKEPLEGMWPYYTALVLSEHGKQAEAIKELRKAYEIDNYPSTLSVIADKQEDMGDYNGALNTLDELEKEYGASPDITMRRGNILYERGDTDAAISMMTQFILENPDDAGGYYRRAFFEDNSNLTDAALDDYNMTVMLMPSFAYAWLGKGDMHQRRGERDKAIEAYTKVVGLDTIPGEDSCAMYALLALDRKDDAVAFMEKVIENDPDDAGNYYDGACFYSRVGDLDKALASLRTAFEKGYRRFHHVRSDDDLEQLRQTDTFVQLMNEFENLPVEEETDEPILPQTAPATDSRVEVPYTPQGGCFSVKCNVNELPLNFIFDTGASIVSISQLEANFMLKNGYLRRDDFVGTGRFTDANGDISEGAIIILRNVEFAGLKLSNVKASVVRNQRAPLLLGQSVLSRLGSIEIDNNNRKLIITQ